MGDFFAEFFSILSDAGRPEKNVSMAWMSN
jgi:hypothetical protein